MGPRTFVLSLMLAVSPALASAEGLLDGRSFAGMIGPAEAPDLEDTLFFRDGLFWSDICAICGFEPGAYTAQSTTEGIVFSGTLRSEDRGQFTYRGLVDGSGAIKVDITWEKRRWYWTSERDIVFRGQLDQSVFPASPTEIRNLIDGTDASTHPACARL